MEKNRRERIRRGSDLVLQKLLQVLRILEKVSRGEDADFSEAYADLVGMKDQLGRRAEDRKLGESLCAIIEAIATNLGRPIQTKEQPSEDRTRKIRLTKIKGKKDLKKAVVGWEEKPPEVGQRYRVFKDDGGIVNTSAVTKVASDHLQTENSVYLLEVLDE